MSVTIVIDGRIKSNRKFGFEIQSSRVIEKRYNSGLKIFSSPTAHYDLSLDPTYELHHSDHQQSTHPNNDIIIIHVLTVSVQL